ncbi:glycosyltransferase family 39 protein [bacterium]|nr:glycosyltransferase family 39 protein [bacterium]
MTVMVSTNEKNQAAVDTSLRSTPDDRLLTRVILASLAVAVTVRLVYALSLPLLENDALTLFQAARNRLAGGPISMVQTLPAMLLTFLYRLTGESLFVSVLPNLIAGYVGIWLCYRLAANRADRTAGLVAAFLYAALPLSMFYGVISKPYALMSTLILAGVYFWDRGIREARAKRSALEGGLAGLSFGAAFACHTFAAHAAFALPIFFAVAIFSKKRRAWLLPTLTAGLTFGLIIAGLVAWRFPTYGWSIFNDYPLDWRFDIAAIVWSSRWEGLTNIFSLAPFVLVPAIAMLAARSGDPGPWPKGWYLASLIVFDALTYLLNPVNHFPRVLLPAAAPLAIFGGIGFARAWRARSWALLAGAVIGLLGAIRLIAEAASGSATGFGLLEGVRPRDFAIVSAMAVAVCLPLAKRTSARMSSPALRQLSAIGIIVAALVYGVMHSHATLNRQVSYYQERLAALLACQSRSNTMGGGDVAHLVLPGTNNWSWLTDLKPAQLERLFTVGLEETLREIEVGCVVAAWRDPEGEQAMLAAFARDHNLPHTPGRNPLIDLEDRPDIPNLYSSERFTTYKLPWYVADPLTDTTMLRRYSPLWKLPIWTIPKGND